MKISGEEGKAATREAGKEWERGGVSFDKWSRRV